MSNSESFIEEVSSEVQKDRLFKLFKKWAWVGVLIIMIVVGFSAYREYSLHQKVEAARAIGDQFYRALELDDPISTITALEGIDAQDPSVNALVQIQIANQYFMENDIEAAIASLEKVRISDGAGIYYQDVALLKLLVLQGNQEPAEQIISELDGLIASGSQLSPLAREVRGYFNYQLGEIQVQNERQTEALKSLREMIEFEETSQNQRVRIQQFLLSVGENVNF